MIQGVDSSTREDEPRNKTRRSNTAGIEEELIKPFSTLKSQPAEKSRYDLWMDWIRLICKRCGFEWEIAADGRKPKSGLCVSCKMRPAKSIAYGDERCIPWHGEFDDYDRPMKNGGLFLPGVRICGHSDCVNGEHLEIVG